MNKILTNEEVILFAEIKGVDANIMIRVKKFLDYKEIRNLLILTEYKRRTNSGKAIKKNVVMSIAKNYNVSCSYVETLAYDKVRNKRKPCVRCNRHISRYIWNKNDGICDRCNEIIRFTYEKEKSIEREKILQETEQKLENNPDSETDSNLLTTAI